MAKRQRKTASGRGHESPPCEKLAFAILVFFLFLVPTKFGLINLDTLPTEFSPVPSFIDPFEQWPDEFGQVIVILIFLLWMISMIDRRRIVFHYSKASLFLWGFLAVGIISTVRSVVIHSSIIHLKWFLTYAILFHLVVNLANTERRQRILIGSFIVGSAVVGIIGLYQYFFGFKAMIGQVYRTIPEELWGDYIARIERGRVFSTFAYPNALAGFIITALPISLAVFLLKRDWLRRDSRWKAGAYSLLVLVPVVLSFVLTGSKGGFLSLGLVAVVGMFIAARLFGISKKIIVVVIAGILVVGTVVVITPQGRELVRKGAYTFSERVNYWRAGVKMVHLRPVLGSGLFSFSTMYNKYRGPDARDVRTAHNNYLQILVETGVVGLLCFLGFWLTICCLGAGAVSALLRGEKAFGSIIGAASLLGIIAFLLHNIVDFDLYVPGITMSALFLAGLVVKNSAGAREHTLIFNKSSTVSIVLLLVTAVFLVAVFFTIKTVWSAVDSHTANSIIENPGQYPEFDDPYAEAERHIRRAIRWDGTNHNYHRQLGLYYLMRLRREAGDFVWATSFFFNDFPFSISLFPELYYFRSERDTVWIEYANKSLAAFARAKELDRYGPLPVLHTARATRYLMELRGDVDNDEILNLWRDVIEHAPTASIYRLYYAKQFLMAGRPDDAVAQFEKGSELDPGFVFALQKAGGEYNKATLEQLIDRLKNLTEKMEQ